MRAAVNAAAGRPSTTGQPGAQSILRGLLPSQMAFLGEYSGAAGDKQVYVQVLCWPTVPAAWSMLAQSLAGLRDQRGGKAARSGPKGSSWLHQAAPQLVAPLELEAPAAESTLASLVRRLPVRFAAGVVAVASTQPSTSDALRYRDLFSESMGAYSTHLRNTQQSACRALIAQERDESADDTLHQAYNNVLPHLDHAARVEGMALIGWPGGDAPLPLEMAQLAATAIGRHLLQQEAASPLFDAVRGQLVPSLHFPLNDASRRRR